MPNPLCSLMLVAVCLVWGSLPAWAATTGSASSFAEQPSASVPSGIQRTDTQQAGSVRNGAIQPDTQKNSTASPLTSPDTGPDTSLQTGSTGSQVGPLTEAEPLADTAASAQPQSEQSQRDQAKNEQPQHAQDAKVCRMLPPLQELITSPFGNRRMPGWLSRRGMVMRDHAGIDIRAHLGWPVTAFKSGTVIRAGENGPLGISVDIRQDDGMTARYGHMAKPW